MNAKSNELVNELVSACIAFVRRVEPDWQTRINKAQRELREYIDELEARAEKAEAMVARLIEAGDVINGDKDSVWTLQTVKERWTEDVTEWKEREDSE